jgi:PAS domain S-box-containing protein
MMRNLLDLYQGGEIRKRLSDVHELVQPVVEEIAGTLGYNRAFVALADGEHGRILGAVGVNVPEALIERLSEVSTEPPGPFLQALYDSRPLRVDDALRDSRIPEFTRAPYAELDLISFAVIPLVAASCVLVVSKDRPVTEADVNNLVVYAGRIMTALAARMEAQRLWQSGEDHAIQEEWLWWALNSVPDPIVLMDEQNEVLLYNGTAERLFKTQPDDSAGKRRAIELNNFLLSAAISSQTLDQGSALARELALVDPIEGDELLYEMITRPATNLRTGDRGIVAVLKNVTDLRRAADEVRRTLTELQAAGDEARRESDRLNLILENVANPIVVTDPDGQILLMNQPAERLLQVSDAPLTERAPSTYRANTKLSSFISQLGLDPDPIRRGEIELIDPDTGEALTLSVTATEIRDGLGTVTGVVSVLHDLTKIRELERRTMEQQLFESEKQAALGRLAATVAHEINNPLEAILNSLYLVLSKTPAEDPNRRFLDIASRETKRVSAIIRQMLGFYRPGASTVPVDVNGVLEETLGLLERELRVHHIAVETNLDRLVPPASASPDQLKQVFMNLVLNAEEAMPDGGTLSVTSRTSKDTDRDFLAGRYVLVQFRDSGTGIPEENLQHIFEPFYSTKRDARGTGLGLWVSLGIVQNFGGQIKVRSRIGRGTTFTVALVPEASHGS